MGDAAEGGWRAERYLDVIGCPDGAGSAVEPPGVGAPILLVLERDDHADRLSSAEEERLRAWVFAGAPARLGAAHLSGWADPRSAEFHGAALRREGWAQMIEPAAEAACATCHLLLSGDSGASAPGATACASCHTDEGGPFACSTCHGQPGLPFPPRDPCFHPEEEGTGGAHAAHATAGIECAVCHGSRTVLDLARSTHGDGTVQVALDADVAGSMAAWDPASRTCAQTCHAHGGSSPTPGWEQTLTLDCSSCHRTPPEPHYAGTCNACHAEATADGSELVPGPLHANGMVDLGDGSGGCGACHGVGGDPWPASGAHLAHRNPSVSEPFACAECHRVPSEVGDTGHLDDTSGAEVSFGPLAEARGSRPVVEADGRCGSVACHGAGLSGGGAPEPRWTDGERAGSCGACHGLPPSAPHSSSATCAAVSCHGGYVSPGPRLTEAGRAVHVNGAIDLWVP